jgi:hypothetical protein
MRDAMPEWQMDLDHSCPFQKRIYLGLAPRVHGVQSMEKPEELKFVHDHPLTTAGKTQIINDNTSNNKIESRKNYEQICSAFQTSKGQQTQKN